MAHWSWRTPAFIPCVPTFPYADTCSAAAAGWSGSGSSQGRGAGSWVAGLGVPGKGSLSAVAVRMYVAGRQAFREEIVAGNVCECVCVRAQVRALVFSRVSQPR
jgi:hypothetical protein